ncbi:MAG: HAD family hydrolase [Muribaculaceae bacterium]|nr:HAD family hydrolase [Muribaculaceae bacterium]
MMTPTMSDVVIFDLDDTLYEEFDFMKSAFHAIAVQLGCNSLSSEMMDIWFKGDNVFETIIQEYNLSYSVEELLDIYRNHLPQISLNHQAIEVLDWLKKKNCILGIITDGRSLTQRNKIKALTLDDWIPHDNIIISDEFGSAKPDVRNYRFFMDKFPRTNYVYVGDNPAKDFITPNELGWRTIGIKNRGKNIHRQITKEKVYEPKVWVENISVIKTIL